MKRGWIGLILLLVLLAGGLITTWHMEKTCEAVSQTLEAAGTLAQAEDWEGAQRLARRARQEWEKNWRLAAALTDHEPMEQVDGQLAQLKVYQDQLDGVTFAALCAQTASQIRDIGEAHGLKWWNLL